MVADEGVWADVFSKVALSADGSRRALDELETLDVAAVFLLEDGTLKTTNAFNRLGPGTTAGDGNGSLRSDTLPFPLQAERGRGS